MSADGRVRDTNPTKTNSAPSSFPGEKRKASDCLNDVNERFKRLKDDVFPDYPYLIKVPSDKPFHVRDCYVNNWAVGRNTLFSWEEEHLQYMSFLSHQNEDTVLVAVGGWADSEGNILPDEEPPKPTFSPPAGGKKTKISLSDYRKKAAEGAKATPEAPKKETAKEKEAKPQEKDNPKPVKPEPPRSNGLVEPAAHKNAQNKKESTDHKKAPVTSPTPVKRKAPDERESESATKKPRIDPKKAKEMEQSPEKRKKSIPAVPKLLSPTLPSSTVTPKIPKLLSPTLPPELEEELAKLPPLNSSSTRKKSNSLSSSSTPAKKLDPKATSTSRPHSGSISSVSSNKEAKSVNSRATTQGKDTKPSVARPVARPASKTVPTPSAAIPATVSSTKPASQKSRLVVKLDYGRRNKRRVEDILHPQLRKNATADKTIPKSKVSGLAASPKDSLPPLSKSDRLRDPSTAQKRPKIDTKHLEQPTKRPRSSTATSVDRPRTPSIQVTKPTPTSASKKLLTPKKELKSTAMKRVGSADSDKKTTRGISPQNGAGKSTKPSPQPTDRDAERRAWREEVAKIGAIGRKLKHASQRYSKFDVHGNEKTSKEDVNEKLSAATAVEAVIAFILAFVADDKAKALGRQQPDSISWRSILAYWKVVLNITKPYPNLHGLCLYLGAISHEAIHSLDLERLAASSIPGDHSPAPTPGSDGNTVSITSEEHKRYKREFAELKARLPDSYREANRLWLEGSRELSDDVLVRTYSATWGGQCRNYAIRGVEKTRPGEYAGEYYLPLGRATTPIEGVRFGLAFLREWCEKEDVDWTARLVL